MRLRGVEEVLRMVTSAAVEEAEHFYCHQNVRIE